MDVTDALPEAEDEGGSGGTIFLLLLLVGAGVLAYGRFKLGWFH
jgi:hypothetical protein